MADRSKRMAPADAEAATWHARLATRRVSRSTLEDFYAWRRTPENAEAWRRVEALWSAADGLSDDPAIDAAIGDALARGRRRHQDRRPIRVALAAVALSVLVGVGVWAVGRTPTYATEIGEQRVIQLADGSTIRLDTGTEVRVRYGGGERVVELTRGQALFDVAADPARPFVVNAGGVTVTAVGTVFDVRRRNGATSVVLISGRVSVAGPAAAPAQRLAPGQQGWATADAITVRAVDVTTATSWTEGRLVFRDTPLSEAVNEMNRYLTDRIELAPGPASDARVSGSFRAGDRAAFVSAATELFGLEARAGDDGRIRLASPQNNSRGPSGSAAS